MLQSIEVTKYHGAFNADSTFVGRISFHPARHSVVAYIAEAKRPEDEKHTRYQYKDDWGSTLEGKSSPIAVILVFRAEWRGDGDRHSTVLGGKDEKSDGRVMVLGGPPNTALGEVIFGPNDDEVTFVTTETMPRRYGLTVCFNRRCVNRAVHYHCLGHQLHRKDPEAIQRVRGSINIAKVLYLPIKLRWKPNALSYNRH